MVPARHAVNPEAADASILDPSGTTTDEELPLVTIDPTLTLVHMDCFGSGCKYPDGQALQLTLPSVLVKVPGEQGMQETEPRLLAYVPATHGNCGAFVPAQV